MAHTRLEATSPFSFERVLDFYALRAVPGVEASDGGTYRRALEVDGRQGILEVRAVPGEAALDLALSGLPATALPAITAVARRVFDLDAPTGEIAAALGNDARLATLLETQAGVRVPGAWDGFELTVRAILGQQISVRAATTIAGRIAARYGERLEVGDGLTRLFPGPERLRRARFNNLGLIGSRAATLRRLASAVAAGDISFDPGQDPAGFRRRLTAIKGIGDWTAEYVMMRALKHPDALPASDLGLIKALAPGRRVTPAALAQRAERWRPWRSYGAMLLWGSGAAGG